MPLRFAANLSMLWAGLPLPAQFERAARAGFGAVEPWWPGEAAAALLPGLTRRSAGPAEETFGWLRDLGPA